MLRPLRQTLGSAWPCAASKRAAYCSVCTAFARALPKGEVGGVCLTRQGACPRGRHAPVSAGDSERTRSMWKQWFAELEDGEEDETRGSIRRLGSPSGHFTDDQFACGQRGRMPFPSPSLRPLSSPSSSLYSGGSTFARPSRSRLQAVPKRSTTALFRRFYTARSLALSRPLQSMPTLPAARFHRSERNGPFDPVRIRHSLSTSPSKSHSILVAAHLSSATARIERENSAK